MNGLPLLTAVFRETRKNEIYGTANYQYAGSPPCSRRLQPRQAERPFLQLSGQLAIDPTTGSILAGGIAEQTQQSLRQVEALLKDAGASWADVLITRVYLATDDDFDAFDAAYSRVVPQPFPARVTVGAQLAPGALVEIDALAVLSH